MYHQMTGRFSFTFLVLVFASMSSLTSLENLSNTLRLPSNSQSNISTETMRNVLAGVTNLDKTSLQFLYGPEYEDAVNHLAEILSKLFIGQMRIKNDGKFETLQQLLIPSTRPVLLVVLERTIKIIQIFEKIRLGMLSSHLVKWLVIMEDESDDNSIVEVGEFINEGTHVTICKINPDGNCDLFFPYVDSKGITRFTGKTTIREKQTAAKNLPKYYSLSGRQMILATKESLMSVRLGRTLPDGSVEVDSGIGGNILNTLSIKLNFTYRAFLSKDNKYGNVQTDGSVTGVLGMVARREATFECATLVLSATYSGMLTAMFALPSYETPIDYLEDLPRAVRKGFTIGTVDGSSWEQFFKTSPDGIYKQTWNLFNHKDRSKSFVGDHMEGTRRVLSKNFVFITTGVIARYSQRVFGLKKFHLSRETFNPLTFGFACQKGSPVRDTIFYMMLRLQDAGIIFKWLDDIFLKIPQSQSTDEEEKKSYAINLTHLQAAFYMLSLGMLISSVTLILERAIFHKTEGKNTAIIP